MPDHDPQEGDERYAVSIDLQLTVENGDWGDERRLSTLARGAVLAALSQCGLHPAPTEISLVLTDDAAVRLLNGQWRGKDRPTNVLSFPAFDLTPGDDLPPVLGDIVIARQTVEREAAAEGKAFDDHFTHLLVHGVLHLCGWDHENEAEAEEMEAREIAILSGLGIRDPYNELSEAG